MNFVPTRPIEEIAQEYIEAFWDLYEPMTVLNRTYRHFLMLGKDKSSSIKNRTPPQRAHLTLTGSPFGPF
jgi:hypothetical protein